MRPVLSVAEMAAVDAAATAHTPLEQLIARAGAAVAQRALALLGGGYGRRVVVVVGKGHNGDDGRVAAHLLERRGVRVRLLDAASAPQSLPACDLVIDAAYGTGLRGGYRPPRPPAGTGVLAVDVPSGLDADTGAAEESVLASATVTFGALKAGLLLGEGPARSGEVEVAPIGLDLGRVTMQLVEDGDLALLPPRPREAHKWQRALYVVAGSPGMHGAAELAARAALRAGAGMVRLGSPGNAPDALGVTEAVARPLPADGFAEAVLEELGRCQALVLGPGLGAASGVAAAVARLLASSPVPVVLDADGLNALGRLAGAVDAAAPLVLTPHDGEFARLVGAPPGPDRVAAARALAARAGAVVLLKGSTTVVADPVGEVRLVNAGSARLATAGTGDVLSGVIGALLARGVDPLDAAALGAHAHGRAASLGHAEGLVAGDLPALVSRVLSQRH